jgi:hypothetical protein
MENLKSAADRIAEFVKALDQTVASA